MIEGSLPIPKLQCEIRDGDRERRPVDFAWPDERVAAEYDGIYWHSGAEAMNRDRKALAALQDVGWVVVPIVCGDVRYRQWEFMARLNRQLCCARAA